MTPLAIIYGIIFGISLALFITITVLANSNEHGNSHEGFKELSTGIYMLGSENDIGSVMCGKYKDAILMKKISAKKEEENARQGQ